MLPSYLFLLTLAPSSTLAITRAIRNSIWETCSPSPIPSGETSDYGCGAALDCNQNGNSGKFRCEPSAALEATKGKQCPPTTCAFGSFCDPNYFKNNNPICKVCRTAYVTCGPSADPYHRPEFDCCPGMFSFFAILTFSIYIYILLIYMSRQYMH